MFKKIHRNPDNQGRDKAPEDNFFAPKRREIKLPKKPDEEMPIQKAEETFARPNYSWSVEELLCGSDTTQRKLAIEEIHFNTNRGEVIQRDWEYNADTDMWTETEDGYTYNPATHEWNWGEEDIEDGERWNNIEMLIEEMNEANATRMMQAMGIPGVVAPVEELPELMEGLEFDYESMQEDVAIGGVLDDGQIAGSIGAGPCVIILLMGTSNEHTYGVSKHIGQGYDSIEKSLGDLEAMRELLRNLVEQTEEGITYDEEWYFLGGERNEETTLNTYVPLFVAAKEMNLTICGSNVPHGEGDTNIDAFLMEDKVYYQVKPNDIID